MRGQSVSKRAAAFVAIGLAVVTSLVATVMPAQRVRSSPRPSPTLGTGNNSNAGNRGYSPYGTDIAEGDQQGEILRANARAEERQRRMVEDANRLVVLTAQYRASITEHRGATAEDSKLLLNIEKLARSVKDRMRGQ